MIKVFFHFFSPFMTNKIKAWHCAWQQSHLISYVWPPPFLVLPPEVHLCALLSALFPFVFLYQPLSSLDLFKSAVLFPKSEGTSKQNQVQVILLPVVANSTEIWIQLCMFFCLPWWINDFFLNNVPVLFHISCISFSSPIARWSMSTNPCCFDSGHLWLRETLTATFLSFFY